MDFCEVGEREVKGTVEVYPSFRVTANSDFMTRGGAFYAVWDENAGRWSQNEEDVIPIVDRMIHARVEELAAKGISAQPKTLDRYRSTEWNQYKRYVREKPDWYEPLDDTLIFSDHNHSREDYSTKRLAYKIEAGPMTAYETLMSQLYSPDERKKLEWAVGAVIAGDSKEIEKFVVLYGAPGTGKSTFLHIIEQLFDGYWSIFDAKLLGSRSNFALAQFKNNPIVAISHDSDLSRIEYVSNFNSVVSHEAISIEEKYKHPYTSRVHSFLFIGTNHSVPISGANSGLIRRMIDVTPTGYKIPVSEYNVLKERIKYELGAIAAHCLDVYRNLGKSYYDSYRPEEMMVRTDPIFEFIREYLDEFNDPDGITLKRAWTLYKQYCEDSGIERKMTMARLYIELRPYYETYKDEDRLEGEHRRRILIGFKPEMLNFLPMPEIEVSSLVLDQTESLLDDILADCPAQYANEEGTPGKKWEKVTTTLKDLDTTQLHYVKLPEGHIVVDFDLRGPTGEKSYELNLLAANKHRPTYAELSQSGHGVHLHYRWDGDTSRLSRVFADGIEIKTYPGDASLRRRLTQCNNVPVATISSGLPLKEEKVPLDEATMKSERGLRRLILQNLAKEIHPGTKPSIDFIHKILQDAYESGMTYDVTDMRPRILAFANNSTNQSLYCIKRVMDMKFASDEVPKAPPEPEDDRLVIFDIEVYPNLCVIGWKYYGSPTVTRMINPTPDDAEKLSRMRIVGFNNRHFDNHILYALMMGYGNLELFGLAQRIINDHTGYFGDAYRMSYADIFDFSSIKQGLKKFQIDLGLNHQELGLPWNEPVPDDMIDKVVEYCVNDVITTEQVFDDRKQDFVARQILAELSGLTVNDPTRMHVARILFGDEKHPQAKFEYTDLSGEFEGYVYDAGVSTYRGETVGEGGYVYAEPGMYENVAVLDVASMHPTTIAKLNLFGPYTKAYVELIKARVAIKRKDYAAARKMLGGMLSPYLDNEDNAKALSDALKLVLNSVYGFTAATFDNPFRDLRNKDNIVAKRGALFMIDLKNMVQEAGFQVVHIKTDSIKIPNADQAIIERVIKFGEDYGYEFEHERTYDRFCLVNDAVYIGRDETGHWDAVGAQFAHPWVYKSLFSNAPFVGLDELAETKTVTKGVIYLELPDGERKFIGRAGSFVPVLEGTPGSGTLLRVTDTAAHAVTGTKGYFWKETALVKAGQRTLFLEDIDDSYYKKLADKARAEIEKFGDFEAFTS